jgi:hypothetical protein
MIFSHSPLGSSIEAITAKMEAPALITTEIGLISTPRIFYLKACFYSGLI